jgi:hypothetical protein
MSGQDPRRFLVLHPPLTVTKKGKAVHTHTIGEVNEQMVVVRRSIRGNMSLRVGLIGKIIT